MDRLTPCPDPPFHRSRGFTFLELLAVLALLGIGVSGLLPAARRWRDRMAVVGAREEVVGLFHRARVVAVARGEATILLTAPEPRVELWSQGELLDASSLGQAHRVVLTLSRGVPRVEIRFDPLGLGRVASQTLRFRRGEETTILVVSSLGRVTRP